VTSLTIWLQIASTCLLVMAEKIPEAARAMQRRR